MPKNFDTKKTYGKSTTDAWSPNYKPQSKTDRTRSQVRSDDARAVSDYARNVRRRLSTSSQSSHRGVR